jgi:hypothetical protein
MSHMIYQCIQGNLQCRLLQCNAPDEAHSRIIYVAGYTSTTNTYRSVYSVGKPATNQKHTPFRTSLDRLGKFYGKSLFAIPVLSMTCNVRTDAWN